MSEPLFYQDVTILTTSYVQYLFNLSDGRNVRVKKKIILVAENTNTDDIFFSFDGSNMKGRLSPGMQIDLHEKIAYSIYLKGNSANQQFRMWAY